MRISKSALWLGVLAVVLAAAPCFAQQEFVRGGVVIFQDDLASERPGEFPSRWELLGGGADTAVHDGGNVISFLTTRTEIKPRMRNQNYLPDSFTLEFDYLMNHFTQHAWEVRFLDGNGRRSGALRITGRGFTLNSARGGTVSEGSTPDSSATFTPGWRRLALSFNQGEMRVFFDGARILNVPAFDIEIRSFLIHGGRPTNARPNTDAFIRNVVVAEGGMPLYQRVMTEGKFVTTDIRFDVNKADIRPESAPVIDQVFQVLRDHPELRFSVEGHTDSDGDPDWNEQLSLARAESVVRRLIEMGIAADRLTAKGWGAARPVADNRTPEGKAQNRRVEFVKQ